ncbi:site-2 protease family protein [Planctomycetota bacterium]
MEHIVIFVLFFMSIVAHEVAHGWTALKLGDPTAKLKGRLSFNPLVHIDPVMTIVVPIVVFVMSGFSFIFGGAKPVPINPFNFKKPDRDLMISSIAGPLTNVMIGLFFSVILMVYVHGKGSGFQPKTDIGFKIFTFITFINFFLAMFNLIPIPPLDGSRVLRYFMPDDIKNGMDRAEPFGMIIVVAILLSPLGKPIFALFHKFLNWYFQFILN